MSTAAIAAAMAKVVAAMVSLRMENSLGRASDDASFPDISDTKCGSAQFIFDQDVTRPTAKRREVPAIGYACRHGFVRSGR
jgi:hypothetical protein